MTNPIDVCIDRWHDHLRGQLEGGLDALLHDDVVFHSPVVFTPQEGKALTMLYLNAAGATFGGDDEGAAPVKPENGSSSGGFRYVRDMRSTHSATLEFETTMSGKYVNGVDVITCDDDGQIIEFKVLIRPLQAVNAVHEQMKAMLERMN